MPIMDPNLKRIAQNSKRYRFYMCRKCNRKFRRDNGKCPRCGWKKENRKIDLAHPKIRRKKGI